MAVANGVWIKTHVYRDGSWLKADVHLVTMGEPTVFTVGVDMAKVVRALKAYHDRYLHSSEAAQISGCIGCDSDYDIGGIFGKITKAAKKVTKNKLVKQIAATTKKVVKSKITGGVVSALAVVYPPVGVPAAAAYAAANLALSHIERGQAIKRAAVATLQQAKKSGVKAVIADKTKKLLAVAVTQEKDAKKKLNAIVQTAKFSEDPKKKADAMKMVKVLEVVAETRAKVRAIPTKAKTQAGKNRVKGLVVNERGGIVYGLFDENPLGKGAALLYRPGKSIPGSFVKVGGCIGCSMGANPWPNL